MNQSRLFLVLTIIFATATAVLGAVASLSDVLPPAWAVGTGIVSAVCLVIQRVTTAIGDAADDGQLNGSYDPGRPTREAPKEGPGRPLLGLLLLIGCLTTCLPACSLSPAQQQALVQNVVVPLSQLGLSAMVDRGVIREGDSLLIGSGVAILTADTTTRDKVIRLADLGLGAAVRKGALQEGDRLRINDGMVIISRAWPAPSATTAAKQPVNILP